MSFQGKTVILFGAGVIASGYAQLFANESANLVIVSRGESSDQLADEIRKNTDIPNQSEIVSIHANASDFEAVGNVYDETAKRFGRIDAVVNGAGGNRPEAVLAGLDAFIELKPEVVKSIFASNLYSKHYSLQHFARYLKDANHQGSVVNITSMSGLHPLSKVIDYSAAYAAVENLTLSVAHLFGKCGIGRVNNIAVGFTIGNQNRRLLLDEHGNPTPRAEEILTGTSQNRFLDVLDIAPHVLYLADSGKSGAINGHTLRIDGGYNLVSLPKTAGYETYK